THFVPNTALVRKWFVKKAGLATGIVTVGTVTGFAVLPPVISLMSANMGWRNACIICAGAFGGIIMLSAAFIIRSSPEAMGLYPDGIAPDRRTEEGGTGVSATDRGPQLTTKQSLRTKNFWYFFVVYSVTGIPLQGILAHVIMWGVELDFSAANSGIIMAALTIPSIPVRILAGWMGDRFGKKRVLVFFNIYCAAIWFVGWFFIQGGLSFFIFIILLGFAYSAPFSLYTPFLGDIFGRAIVGTLMGAITLGHGIIGGTGPLIWGWIADTSGSYRQNCFISAACYVVVVIALLAIKPPIEDRYAQRYE
ncbi:MAG: MFS transporter, partial [Desulfobacteraceae bacterium]